MGEFQPVSSFQGDFLLGSRIAVTANFTGTATSFEGLDERVTVNVRVGLYDLRTALEGPPGDDSPNPEYPLVSVTYGQFRGGVHEINGGIAFIFNCCFSETSINGVWLDLESEPLPLDDLPASEFQPLDVVLIGQPAYTPEVTAVPEPTSLLLLGGGLIGAAWKRKQVESPSRP